MATMISGQYGFECAFYSEPVDTGKYRLLSQTADLKATLINSSNGSIRGGSTRSFVLLFAIHMLGISDLFVNQFITWLHNLRCQKNAA